MKLDPQVYKDAARDILRKNVILFDEYVHFMDKYFVNEWSSSHELCLQFLFMAHITEDENENNKH